MPAALAWMCTATGVAPAAPVLPSLPGFGGLPPLAVGSGPAGAGSGLPAGFQMPSFGSKTQLRISGFPPKMTEQEVGGGRQRLGVCVCTVCCRCTR